MNIKNLELAIRNAVKGENTTQRTDQLTPAEHRSLQSLSFQIAANCRAEKGSSTTAFVKPELTWL